MGIMNSVMGETGQGVQPKDNPNPFSPPKDNEAEVMTNSLPQNPTLPQMASTAQSSPDAVQALNQDMAQAKSQPVPQDPDSKKDQDDIDSLFNEFEGEKKPKGLQKELDKKHGDAIDGMFDEFDALKSPSPLFRRLEESRTDNVDPNAPIVEPKKPGQSYWDWASQQLPNELKFIGARMRSALGRDPIEQRAPFESMFGKDNVKTVGNSLYFKPEGSDKFRKVDQTLFNSLTDFVLFKALPNALPMAANVGAQALATTETGGGALGLGLAGAAGGGAEAATRQGMISLIDRFSSQSQNHADAVKETLKDMGLNAIASPILGKAISAISYPIRKYGGELISALSNAVGVDASAGVSAEEQAMHEAGHKLSKLAQVRVAFKEFRDAIFPIVEKYGPADSGQVPKNEFGKVVGDAVDKTHETLSKAVGAIKNESIALADSQQKNVSMQGTLQTLKNTLTDNGYKFDEMGKALPFDAQGDLTKAEKRSALNTLASYYNRLSDSESSEFGSNLSQVYKDIDDLTSSAKFDQHSPLNADVRNLFKQVRNSAAVDRNAFLDDLYAKSQSQNKEIWKTAFDKYSQNIDAISSFKASFATPQERELLVSSLRSAPNADKLEMLDGLKQVLGKDSKEWGALKGEIYDQVMNDYSHEGVLNAGGILKYMTQSKNAPFIDRLFEPQEKKALNKMLIESSKFDTSGVMTSSSKEIIEDGLRKLIEFNPTPKGIVSTVFKLFQSNKKAIDYLTDDGFLAMASKAESPEIKQKIYESLRLMDGLKAKMTIVDVPTITERGAKKITQRYAPFATAAASSAFNSRLLEPYAPQNAPNPPAPIQQ